jgi:hypothetical protein
VQGGIHRIGFRREIFSPEEILEEIKQHKNTAITGILEILKNDKIKQCGNWTERSPRKQLRRGNG